MFSFLFHNCSVVYVHFSSSFNFSFVFVIQVLYVLIFFLIILCGAGCGCKDSKCSNRDSSTKEKANQGAMLLQNAFYVISPMF
jgi:hypothetical protein